MRRIQQFIREAGGWAMASEVAGTVFFLVAIWDKAHNGSVSAFTLLCVSVPLFWIGGIIAYIKKCNEVETFKKERNIPELYLHYEDSYRNDIMNSCFFLRVEGERKASNVAINSEETIGDNHVRLEMK